MKRTRETIRYYFSECSLGQVLVAASGTGLCAVLIDNHPQALLASLRRHFPDAHLEEAGAELVPMAEKVVAFIEHPAAGTLVPLDIRGTAFQKSVWAAIQAIPAGSTASYADIARAVKLPKAARAVAGACGANMLAVIIPCHRVIKSDGTIAGYRWGAERRRALLQLEKMV